MPYADDLFYFENLDENIYEEKGLPTEYMREIIARINDKADVENKLCNIALLVHGDYDCDGELSGTPCTLSLGYGFCTHQLGVCCK